MSLDPQTADLLERVARASRPAFWEMTPQQARDGYARGAKVLEIPAARMERVDDFSIRTSDGHALPLRLYVPRRAAAPLPLLVFCHGGGFTIGSPDTHDQVCRMFAKEAECLVLSVDYRLAPEHKFPTAVDDAWEALQWAHGNARRLGADASRMAVAGDSAGGTLTAVNAIRARDAGWQLALQLLIYPGTGGHQNSASHVRLTEGYLLDAKTIQWFFAQYLRSNADRDDWRFAPLDAPDAPSLSGVAPACVLVAGYDPLHDEGLAYADKLRDQGVPVVVHDYPGMVHGFFNFGGYLSVARQAHRDAVEALRQAFNHPD